MNSPRDPQFDRYAGSYRDLHKTSVLASGEEPEYFAAYKVAWMAAALGGEFSARRAEILDFGCGVGGSIPHLCKYFPRADLFGVDVSGESLGAARRAHPQVSYSQITTDRIDLPDACVDVAMAACVYHHIPPSERPRWTAEISRVLRPGGRLFLFEHNPLNPLTRKVVRDCPFDDDAILLPGAESLQLMQGAEFHEVDLVYIVFFPRLLARLRPLEKALGWLPLGAQYVVQGRK